MFERRPGARADITPGVLYAIKGEQDWIYYGQITSEKAVGFFYRRDRKVEDVETVLQSAVMAIVDVGYPSITNALRSGAWMKMGRFNPVAELMRPRSTVQWPVGTLDVTVWTSDAPSRETRVEDPAIQQMELMAVWDAEAHIPGRLTKEFGAEPGEWHVGGLIWREREIKEERALRWPDRPEHRLPSDWKSTKAY